MSVVLLVRHGQASFGAADYDVLSPTGEQQAGVVGAALAKQGVRPTRVIRGTMKRHQQTLDGAVAAAGWDVPVVVDERWNEFDHLRVLADHPVPEGLDVSDRRDFQRWFEAATSAWIAGTGEVQQAETFSGFVDRALAGLRAATDGLGPGGAAVVFTSGGAIAAVISQLLADSPQLWQKLNAVTVNTGVSKLVVGSRGTTMVSFNEHAHLDAQMVTYR